MAVFLAVSKRILFAGSARLIDIPGHGMRSFFGPSDIRLCIRRFMAMDILGRLDRRWSLARLSLLPSRDLRTYHLEEESETHAEGV